MDRCTVVGTLTALGGRADQAALWVGGRETLITDDGQVDGTGVRSAQDLAEATGSDRARSGESRTLARVGAAGRDLIFPVSTYGKQAGLRQST